MSHSILETALFPQKIFCPIGQIIFFQTTPKNFLTPLLDWGIINNMELEYRPSYRADLIKRFGSRIPTTAEGLPTGYYRVDLLPTSAGSQIQGSKGISPSPGAVLAREEGSGVHPAAKANAMASPQVVGDDGLADHLRSAFTHLTFDHGYPAMPNGMPFWHKLEFESGFAFAAFQFYLESGDKGPRELHLLSENAELHRVAEAQAGKTLLPIELLCQLREYFTLNCWQYRAKAFDLYKESAWRHQRLKRQSLAEDRHHTLAERLLEQFATYFASPRFMDEMTPKVAIDALSKLVAIQRISLGLPASGPLPVNQAPNATSFEMIMREVATAQGAGQIGGARGNVAQHTKDMLDQVLLDPAAALNLQEVIIRVTSMSAEANKAPERRFTGRDRAGIVFEEAEFIDVSTSNVPR